MFVERSLANVEYYVSLADVMVFIFCFSMSLGKMNALSCSKSYWSSKFQMHDPWMLAETTRVTEFQYYFACTRKGVHLYSVMSPGKMIFAVLGLW